MRRSPTPVETFLGSCVAVVSVSCGPVRHPATLPQPPAKEAFSLLLRAYEGAVTYKDHGTVVESIVRLDQPPTVVYTTFSTAFERPDRLRVQLQTHEGELGDWSLCVWNSDGVVQSVDTQNGQHTSVIHDSLGGALTTLVGAPGGVIWEVPAQLIRAGYRQPPYAAVSTGVFYVAEEVVNGRVCDVLRYVGPKGEQTFWIDRNSHLLRRKRLISHHERGEPPTSMFISPEVRKEIADAPSFTYEAIIDYEPILDSHVVSAELKCFCGDWSR